MTQYTSVSKTIHLTFDHNFGKFRPIYEILSVTFSLSCSLENYVHTSLKDSPHHLKYVSTLPCETRKSQLLPISMTYCM